MKDLIKKIGPSRLKTGKPVPPNTLQSGNIKSTGTKNVGQRMDKAITKQLMRPGAKIPLPVSPNREQDFEIDKVDNDQIVPKVSIIPLASLAKMTSQNCLPSIASSAKALKHN